MNIELETGQDTANPITIQSEETAAQSVTTVVPPRVKTAAERVAEAFSSLNAPVTTTLPSNAEIIEELVIGLQRQYSKRFYWIILLAFLFMAVGIICFTILGYVSNNETTTLICSMCGVFSLTASFVIFLLAIIVRCVHRRRPKEVARGHIRYIMRIEGDQWKRFITYFCSASGRPSGVRGWWFCCEQCGLRHRRLLMRNHGHIVFGTLGFMVDELFCTTYDRHIVLNVELLPMIVVMNEDSNEPIVDTVMRVWLCRRVYNRRWGPPTPFKVDIFLASEIPSYEIPGIVKYVAIR